MPKTFYVTTPIYYVNAEPHLGHAYSTIVADVLNRFHILCGEETFFLTGTDEHGDKIVKAAEKAGESPATYAERISGMFRQLWPGLNISNSDFIRTTEPRHQAVVQSILNLVKERGDIYFSEYEGLYCYGCERFYTEKELVDGKCPDHLTPPDVIREANYFFKMSRYQDWLRDHIERNPEFIRPERYRNEVLSFLREPLEDLCISRPKSRLTWGIPLPFDDRFVTYVWFDALINYVSALEYPGGEKFRRFWPVAQHIIAKDILKPHGIYWPCMLKAAGIEPYQHLNVHGYWIINQGKMSKSLGNVVNPLAMVDRYGLDAFRYFLMREMAFGLDSDFSEEAFILRVNADLANDLGNLVSRSTAMVTRYFGGNYPEPGPSEPLDDELKAEALSLIGRYLQFMLEPAFHKALNAVWEVINRVNKYIDETAPWVLAKSGGERLGTVMAHILETLRIVSALLWPFMPDSAEKIQEQLGLSRQGRELTIDHLEAWGKELPVRPIRTAQALFPRIEVKAAEVPGQNPAPQAAPEEEEKLPLITFEAFQQVDLRVGTILKAEAIKKSKKLVKLTVDLGEERTIVAGIKEHYAEDELVGKQVLVVANLAPVKLMGVESHGMVLAASDANGLHLLAPEQPKTAGTRVK